MKPTSESTYERSRRLVNILRKTVALQCNRIQREEPEDEYFALRRWADYEFLINALSRLRRMAVLASGIEPIKVPIEEAISQFDKLLPYLNKMRNTLEHVDEYAVDAGRDKTVSRKSLEVGDMSEGELGWLGYSLKISDVIEASNLIFLAIINAGPIIKEQHKEIKLSVP